MFIKNIINEQIPLRYIDSKIIKMIITVEYTSLEAKHQFLLKLGNFHKKNYKLLEVD